VKRLENKVSVFAPHAVRARLRWNCSAPELAVRTFLHLVERLVDSDAVAAVPFGVTKDL